MKKSCLLVLALPFVIALSACDKAPSPSSNAQNSINDALDRRPNEKIRDAAEDTSDAVKRAAGDIKDAAKDATK